MKGISGVSHVRRCSGDMSRVSFSHNRACQVAGAGQERSLPSSSNATIWVPSVLKATRRIPLVSAKGARDAVPQS
jgi:hypothetical protein